MLFRSEGALQGVFRATLLEHAPRAGWPVREERIAPSELRQQSGVFLSASTYGVRAVIGLDGHSIPLDPRWPAFHAWCEGLFGC